jgi:hypothetical protein
MPVPTPANAWQSDYIGNASCTDAALPCSKYLPGTPVIVLSEADLVLMVHAALAMWEGYWVPPVDVVGLMFPT